MSDQANNSAGTIVVEETITLDAQGHPVGAPHLTVHAAAAEVSPAPEASTEPVVATSVKRVLTEADHVPYGVGGEYVLLPNGIRVPAALYEESQG